MSIVVPMGFGLRWRVRGGSDPLVGTRALLIRASAIGADPTGLMPAGWSALTPTGWSLSEIVASLKGKPIRTKERPVKRARRIASSPHEMPKHFGVLNERTYVDADLYEFVRRLFPKAWATERGVRAPIIFYENRRVCAVLAPCAPPEGR
jgi:hypothetical protein